MQTSLLDFISDVNKTIHTEQQRTLHKLDDNPSDSKDIIFYSCRHIDRLREMIAACKRALSYEKNNPDLAWRFLELAIEIADIDKSVPQHHLVQARLTHKENMQNATHIN